MPNITISIGGREFEVACQEGEEHFLHSAAKMLDAEAAVLVEQIGRMPEARMLLMAGLMLADKTAGVQDQLQKALGELKTMRAELDAAKGAVQERYVLFQDSAVARTGNVGRSCESEPNTIIRNVRAHAAS
jgi:cell division protein ZapA (FtsZ GTPase activity inhibitor)